MNSEFTVELNGKRLDFSTGKIAKQAAGSVVLTVGETVVFAAATVSKDVREGQDFFPLSVEYKEKFYAAGRFPGGYIKREGRPTEHEILACRLADRPIRPLFPKGFLNEVQIVVLVLSNDGIEQPDVLGINAASAALSISGVPFLGPVGAVRIGRIDGKFVVNPGVDLMSQSDIDLIVAGTENAVTMIEGVSKNVSEEDMLEAVVLAHDNIKKICQVQKELKAKYGKPEIEYTVKTIDEELKGKVLSKYSSEVLNLLNIHTKEERDNAFNDIVAKAKEDFLEEYPESGNDIYSVLHDCDQENIRTKILNDKVRPDGRSLDEIRNITIELDVLPRAHGSAIFTRGQTQSLGVITLGTEKDSQSVDRLFGEEKKRFMLHYNFPPFSVGECGRFGGTGRREVGHGNLAERALTYTVPSDKDFPYTIRIVSEIMESNGSSSMASVCSGSLALFSAGVPVKSPIAGIAMGLILEGDKFAVLSDILGLEDHMGDMDFKVAGTKEGITTFQMDIKIEGITPEIMKVALEQAKRGRLHILEKMNEAIAAPKDDLSRYAPRIETISVNPEKVGALIGPGGKTIKNIIERTGAEINISDDGMVLISAVNKDSIDQAIDLVKAVTSDVEKGKIYEGVVKRIMDFGAFVEIIPGKEGLLHISKIDNKKVRFVTDVLSIGDSVKVKVLDVDQNGRIDLSRKDALDSK